MKKYSVSQLIAICSHNCMQNNKDAASYDKLVY